jgi:hypothetical protein
LFWKTHCSPCHPVMIQWSECSIVVFSLFWKSHCSPCHPVMIQWSECSIVFSLFWKSHCSPCHPVMIQWSEFSIVFQWKCKATAKKQISSIWNSIRPLLTSVSCMSARMPVPSSLYVGQFHEWVGQCPCMTDRYFKTCNCSINEDVIRSSRNISTINITHVYNLCESRGFICFSIYPQQARGFLMCINTFLHRVLLMGK